MQGIQLDLDGALQEELLKDLAGFLESHGFIVTWVRDLFFMVHGLGFALPVAIRLKQDELILRRFKVTRLGEDFFKIKVANPAYRSVILEKIRIERDCER